MEHLAKAGINCPTPVHDAEGRVLRTLAGRPAAIVTFLEGVWIRRPQPRHCAAVGKALAGLHVAGRGFGLTRANGLGLGRLAAAVRAASRRAPTRSRRGLRPPSARSSTILEARWPAGPGRGVIHADLFPDNVFFLGDSLSGLIDFYFACNDALAYDIAVDPQRLVLRERPQLQRHQGAGAAEGLRERAPAGAGGAGSLPLLARGAALRFLLTRGLRLAAHGQQRAGQPQGPGRVPAPAQVPSRRAQRQRVRPAGGSHDERRPRRQAARHHLHRRRLLRESGPGGWGAILMSGAHRKELYGGEPATTNNRMELMAAISALEALTRPRGSISTPTRNTCRTASATGSTAGSATAGAPAPAAGQERRPVAAARCGAARHEVRWHWVRGHAGHPENERADELAREGMRPFMRKGR